MRPGWKGRQLPPTFVKNYGYFGPERRYTTHQLPAGFDLERVSRILKKVVVVGQSFWPTVNTIPKLVQVLEQASAATYLWNGDRIAAGYYLLGDRAGVQRTVERIEYDLVHSPNVSADLARPYEG